MGSATVTLQRNTDFGILENKLQDPCATPMYLPMDFLKAITCDFSEEQELGRGGFGVVYKGVLQNGKMIAVKKLLEIQSEDGKFLKELTNLMDLKHQNIVHFVGYCAESRWEATRLPGGKYVLGEIPNRLLCFEYLHNKSLDKHISAESCGLEWHVRYEIIRGISCGLHYLHKECHIVHLDLKPENILLDDNMGPKIADFGISRLFGQKQSRIITGSRVGTLGYMAPEYLANGVISTKSDLFSFGAIIIELMTGHRNYPQSTETSFQHFIDNVVEKWRNRLETAVRYTSLEIYSQQVYRCIEIGLNCVDPDPKKRPTAWDIIQMLNEVEHTNWPPVGQASHVGTLFSNGTAKSSNLTEDFDIVRTGPSTSRTANATAASCIDKVGTSTSKTANVTAASCIDKVGTSTSKTANDTAASSIDKVGTSTSQTANVTAASCIDKVGTSTSQTKSVIAASCVAVRKSRTEILAFNVAKKFVSVSNIIKSMKHLQKIVRWSESVAAQETKIGILSFEVANTIVKGSTLMESLSQESVGHLKEVVLRSEGVHCLISEDHNQLLLFVEADIREQLREFTLDVIRFGNRCKDPLWRNLDRYFYKLESFQTPREYFILESELTHQKCSKEAAVSTMQYLIELAERTSELFHYQETYALDKFKEEKPIELRGGVTSSSAKNHKNIVAKMQKKSLWFKNMEDIVEKLVDIAQFMYLEINSVFYKVHRDQYVQPVSNLGETLGSTGLTLHYAQVVLQINALALASPSVPKIARDALYQTLPPSIKLILHTKLRECLPMEKTTVTEVRAEMDRILQWLVPFANSTRLYHNNGAFGERAMKGAEVLDVDNLEDYKYNISAIPGFNSAYARVNKIQTLFYADKGRTEGYILYLVQALHRLVYYHRDGEKQSQVGMNRSMGLMDQA